MDSADRDRQEAHEQREWARVAWQTQYIPVFTKGLSPFPVFTFPKFLFSSTNHTRGAEQTWEEACRDAEAMERAVDAFNMGRGGRRGH